MAMSKEQLGVLKGMAAAVIIITVVFVLTEKVTAGQFAAADPLARLLFTLKLESVPALWLVFAIGRLANFRFFSPADIDGAGLTEASPRARIMQAVLQNSLEQTVLAVLVHLAWSVYMPAARLGAVVAAVVLFIAGRILFAWGYARGAPARAMGFGLTFYPSVWLLLVLFGNCLASLF